MKWQSHINHITKSVNFVVYRLRHFKNLLSFVNSCSCSYFSPSWLQRFSHGQFTWTPILPSTKITECLSKVFLEYQISCKSIPWQDQTWMVDRQASSEYLRAVHIFITLNIGKPMYLKEKGQIYIPLRDLRPKNRPHLVVNTSKNHNYNYSSLVFMISYWIPLPEDIN